MLTQRMKLLEPHVPQLMMRRESKHDYLQGALLGRRRLEEGEKQGPERGGGGGGRRGHQPHLRQHI